MKQLKSKYLIFSILFVWLFTLSAVSQTYDTTDIDKHFSKKEKALFELAINYQKAFYNKFYTDTLVDFSEIKIKILAFYDNYAGQIVGGYSPFSKTLMIRKDKKTENSYMKTAYHELSHALLHLYSGCQFFFIPSWLNEGLADYLEDMTYNSKKIVHKKNEYLIARVKTLIELRDFDFADFATWDYERFSRESLTQEHFGYAVGYCMVFFLINKDEKTAYSFFNALLKENTPTIEFFDENYTGGFSQFEKDFIKYYSE